MSKASKEHRCNFCSTSKLPVTKNNDGFVYCPVCNVPHFDCISYDKEADILGYDAEFNNGKGIFDAEIIE